MRKRYARALRAHYWIALVLMIAPAQSTLALAQSGGNHWSVNGSVRRSEERDRERSGEPFPNQFTNGADVSLTFSTRTERSQLGLFGRVGANFYDDDRFQDQGTYGGGFSWNYRASSRSNMSLSQAFSKNLRLDTLSSLGVVTNDLSTLSATTSWSFSTQSGPRTSWNAGVSYQFTELTNNAPIPGSQIVLDEQPFGDGFSIPIIDTAVPTEVELPNGEQEILRILATEGLAGTDTRSQAGSASFGLNHSIGRYTTLGFSVGGSYRTIDARFAQDGSAGSAQAFLQRALGGANALNVGYTFERSFIIDPNTTIQTLYGGWTYSPGDGAVTATLFGGASRFSGQGSPSVVQPVANAALSGRLTGSTTASVSYRRQFSMPLGFGQSLLLEFANASINQSFGSRVNASASVGASFGSDPLDDASQLDTRRAGGSLSVGLVGGLSVGTSYYYVENEQQRLDSVFDEKLNTWSIYLTFGTEF